jgi:TonB family protein
MLKLAVINSAFFIQSCQENQLLKVIDTLEKTVSSQPTHIESQATSVLDSVRYNADTIASSIPKETIIIGSHEWMTKNLNVERFRNGDLIPQAATREDWQSSALNKRPAWCYYNCDPSNADKYGKLYNWYAVNDSRGLAPAGFRVAIAEDWPVENGTVSSGLNCQAAGQRSGNGSFVDIGKYGFWWTAHYDYGSVLREQQGYDIAKAHCVYLQDGRLACLPFPMGAGYSVRCLRDGLAGEANQVGKGNGNLKSSKLDEAPKQSLRDGLTGGGEGGGNGTGNGIGSGSGSGMSWKLDGRSMKSTPKVNGTAPDDGTVTVDIWVDANGNVTKVIANAAKSNTSNGTLFRMAEDAARKAKFSSSPTGNEQKGSIKITFKLP